MQKRMLPVGIENFEEIRQQEYYYIDKTRLIDQILSRGSKVNLFTRPRRFGKTLNMSMLQYFFEIGTDKTLFDGLYIAQKKELCDAHMGKYPVIFVTLKDVDGLSFEEAKHRLISLVGREAGRFRFLLNSDKLSEYEKKKYRALIEVRDGRHTMNGDVLDSSIQILSQLLALHYGQKAIILIDEYDVPLDRAFQNGYYRDMVSLIRGFLGQALKTNNFLKCAVLTGCLRVSKESIFTGLNNLDVFSITDVANDEQFGFTEKEVQILLQDYGFSDKTDLVREWYDGYHFGNADIYCPWDVIKFVQKLREDPLAQPEAFWINTSGNGLVKRFVDKANKTTRNELERLVAGEIIEKPIRLDLTYDELDTSIENLWSVLFTTGYLTQADRAENGIYKLVIPNKEVREVFVFQSQEWFKERIRKDQTPVNLLCRALENGEAEDARKQLTSILRSSISILDTKARDAQKENFYHGLLIGLLQNEPEWAVRSNREAGEDFSDILIEPEDPDAGIVIEVKYSPTMAGLENACAKALAQIRQQRYDEYFREEGCRNILAYGIAFCKKNCAVAVERI